VDSIVIFPAGAVLNVGDTIQYVARTFADGVEVTGRQVVWSTPSQDVISLTEAGVVVALRSGYGQVDATVGDVTVGVGLTVVTGTADLVHCAQSKQDPIWSRSPCPAPVHAGRVATSATR
jgi:hypothetical protein